MAVLFLNKTFDLSLDALKCVKKTGILVFDPFKITLFKANIIQIDVVVIFFHHKSLLQIF